MRSYLNIMHEQAQQNNYDPDVILISQRKSDMQNVMSAILQSVYTAFSRVHVTCHYSEGNMQAHFKFRKKKDLDQHRLFSVFD